MSDDWELYGDQTDRWGYTRYSIVVHAPPEIAQAVMQFRAAIGMADLRSEPHVSLISHLHQPDDLPALETRLRRVLSTIAPVRLYIEPRHVEQWSATGGGLTITATPSLLALRDALVQSVTGVIQGVRPRFEPQLTVYQNATPEEVVKSLALAPTCRFPESAVISTVDLVGRIGPPRGGQRRVIGTFDLASEGI